MGEVGLHLSSHLCELPPDHLMVHQLLPERLPLQGVLQSLLVAHSRETIGLNAESQSLIVEVLHDVLEPLVLLADQVLHRNVHVLKSHVSSPTRPHAHALHLTSGDPLELPFDQKHTHTVHSTTGGTCANGCGEVVGKDSIGDPLLLSVHDVVLSIWSLSGLRCQPGNITSCSRLGDGQADELLSLKAGTDNSVLQGLRTVVKDRRQTNRNTLEQSPHNPTTSRPRDLIEQNQKVEGIKFFRTNPSGHLRSCILHFRPTNED
mmetsp:Transcript_10887/g.21065  ORF Transcript_10887/g.21065 Transcript_10887/m.21065 type:complete len:262 (-) Transcript_10887:653-1438(-)